MWGYHGILQKCNINNNNIGPHETLTGHGDTKFLNGNDIFNEWAVLVFKSCAVIICHPPKSK